MMSCTQADSVVGRPAYVTVAIPGGSHAGEVLLRIRGGTESYIAYADEPVGVGTQVIVLADRGARSVLVAPL
jgi:membrane protein implicated in regulation of membrane protease activity